MIKLMPTLIEDVEQIRQWCSQDIYHKERNNPSWWLTGNGLIAFSANDDKGRLFYVRIDKGEYAQLSVQFAPRQDVGKKRLVVGMIKTMPIITQIAKTAGSKGFIFESESPTLIHFMSRLKFQPENGSYKLTFGE